MKLLNIALISIIIVILGGYFFIGINNTNDEIIEGSNTLYVASKNQNVVQIEEQYLYINEGTTFDEILDNIKAADNSAQTYRFATSEGTDKTQDIIYEYDRLYVTSENKQIEGYYILLFDDLS